MRTARLFGVIVLLVVALACNTKQQSFKSSTQPKADTVKDFAYGSEPVVPGIVEAKPVAAQQPTYLNPHIALRNLFKKLEKPAEVFTLKAAEDSQITGAEGVIVSFKANSLVYEATGEKVTGDVTVRLKEYHTTADILMADLSTTSKGALLETGGMIYIEASAQGRKCSLAEGETIEVQFPVGEDYKPGMQTFYGEQANGQIDWVPAVTTASITGLSSIEVAATPKPLLLATASEEDLWPYIKETSRYPASALTRKDTGTVYVSFEIDNELRPIKPLIEVSLSPALDKSAYYIVSNIPRWAPADTIPNAEQYRYLVPIKFIVPRDLSARDYEQARNYERTINRLTVQYSNRALSRMGKGASVEEIASWASAYNASITPDNLRTYLITSSSLGYINCDRWIAKRTRLTDFIVNVPSAIGADVNLVFHNERSFMSGIAKGDTVRFRNVPENRTVTVVAMRAIGETAYLATGITNTSSSKGVGLELKFEKMTVEEMKERLKELNEVGV